MENGRIIRDVMDLLKIPDIGQSLLHKIEELKFIISRSIDTYREAAEMIRSLNRAPQNVKGTEFELHRVGENLWIPSIPSLAGKKDDSAYNILPQPLIDYIVCIRTEKRVVVMKPGVELAALKGRIFDLFVEKISPDFIWGVVNEHKMDHPGIIEPDPRTGTNTFRNVKENAEKDEIIKLLLYYLLTCDSYYHHVSNEFFFRWKPLIDSRLLTEQTDRTEITAT